MNIIIANLIGIFALIISLLIFQASNFKKMIIRQIIYSLLMIIEYLLLGAYIALFASFIALIRSIIFYHYKRNDRVVPNYILFVLIAIMLYIQTKTYVDIFSLIPLVIFILITIKMQTKKILRFKKYCILFSILWIIYNLHVKAYVAAVSSFLDIMSIIYSLSKH